MILFGEPLSIIETTFSMGIDGEIYEGVYLQITGEDGETSEKVFFEDCEQQEIKELEEIFFNELETMNNTEIKARLKAQVNIGRVYPMQNGNRIKVNHCVQNGELTYIEWTVKQKDGYWSETLSETMPNTMFESEYLFLNDKYRLV